MMKPPENKSGVEEPVFHWDHDSSRALRKKRGSRSDHLNKRDFDAYFDFLEEIKPHLHELQRTRVFKKPFTIV